MNRLVRVVLATSLAAAVPAVTGRVPRAGAAAENHASITRTSVTVHRATALISGSSPSGPPVSRPEPQLPPPSLTSPQTGLPPRTQGLAQAPVPAASLTRPTTAASLKGQAYVGLDRSTSGNEALPDTQLAAGVGFAMEQANGGVSIRDSKTGTELAGYPKDLKKWWCKIAGNPPGCTTSPYRAGDPRVIFDPVSGRFFATVLFFSNSQNVSAVDLAMSTSGDPSGSWAVYNPQPQSSGIFDQPKLAVNDDKITLAANYFKSSTSGFDHAELYVLEKADVLALSNSVRAVFFNIHNRFNPIPVTPLTRSEKQYLVYPAGIIVHDIGVIKLKGTPAGGNLVESENDAAAGGFSDPQGATQPGTTLKARSRDQARLLFLSGGIQP